MIFGATEIEVSCILVKEFLLFIVHNQFEKILLERKNFKRNKKRIKNNFKWLDIRKVHK